MTSDSLIKVRPTTKTTPTLVSNTYACLANNNDDDDDDGFSGCNATTNRVQRTGKSVQGMNNKKMTSQGMDERDDDEDDDTNNPSVVVATLELQNTVIKKKSSTMAVFELGTMININKGMPGLDNSDNNASAVTIATKNSSEGKYNEPMAIPQGFSIWIPHK